MGGRNNAKGQFAALRHRARRIHAGLVQRAERHARGALAGVCPLQRVLLGAFALLALLKLFAAPLKLTGKLLVNTLLGFALLGLLNVLGVLARLSLGLNLFNALVIAILGVPGLALLILLRLVFI